MTKNPSDWDCQAKSRKRRFMRVGFALVFMLFFSMSGFAQYVTKGRVIDQYGNPLSDAKVQGKGTSKYTTTGIDGSFSLETAVPLKKVEVTSLGKNKKVKRVDGETTIMLKDANWFTENPDRYHWFVNAQVGLLSKDSKDVPVGVMGGMVKHVGFFAKVMYSGIPSTESGDGRGYTGNYKTGYFSAVAGPVVRLFSPIHLYVGAGYVKRVVAYEASDNKYYELNHGNKRSSDNGISYLDEENVGYDGLELEGGLMFNWKKIMLNGGISFGGHDMEHRSVHFGVGYKF